jgi:hypothetical protein
MNVGDMVMLIGCDDFMPPIGSVGEIVGTDLTGGIFDFEVHFPDHPWPGSRVDPTWPNWLIPPYWLMKIEPPKRAVVSTTVGSSTA